MTQQIVNIGSAPNDGAGDPLRTAFNKCNVNFTELYALAPASPSTSLPLGDATPAVVGTSTAFAREDHIHPTDTSRAAATYVDTQDALRVAKAGDTMTGDLTISKASATIVINKPDAASELQIISKTNSAPRWLINVGNATAETGGNVGSNFFIARFNDAGTYIDTPFSITRSTGLVSLGNVAIGGGCGFAGSAPGSLPGVGNSTVGVDIGAGYIASSRTIGASGYYNLNADGAEIYLQRSGIAVGNISVTTTATAYNTASSADLKQDLQTFDAGVIIDATNVYNFEWKSAPGERSYGVLAQQAKDVYPAAVTHDDEKDWWGIDYSKYVPVIMQELKSLRARVALLEGKLPT
jgi:hypothetical protein